MQYQVEEIASAFPLISQITHTEASETIAVAFMVLMMLILQRFPFPPFFTSLSIVCVSQNAILWSYNAILVQDTNPVAWADQIAIHSVFHHEHLRHLPCRSRGDTMEFSMPKTVAKVLRDWLWLRLAELLCASRWQQLRSRFQDWRARLQEPLTQLYWTAKSAVDCPTAKGTSGLLLGDLCLFQIMLPVTQ